MYEWDDEPVSEDFEHVGLACSLRRGPAGHWCGYVALPAGHPLHGVKHNEQAPILQQTLDARESESVRKQDLGLGQIIAIMRAASEGAFPLTPEAVLSVHGGITYSRNYCPKPVPFHNEPYRNPCHESYPAWLLGALYYQGEVLRRLWWFGFDCNHSGDASPSSLLRPVPGFGFLYDGHYRNMQYAGAECRRLAEQLAAIAHDKEPGS